MRAAYALIIFSFLTSCIGLSGITSAGPSERERILTKCRAPFLEHRWRLVHLISGTLPGGANVSMIGVSDASPLDKVHCTLMTIEGLVLLDAEYDGALAIKRGIGPFTSEDFVTGVIRDMGLVLFQPEGMAETGLDEEGEEVCRYRSEEGVTDEILKRDGTVELRRYDASLNLARVVTFKKLRRDGIPGRIELEGYGMVRYSLELDLIEAERLD
jgi:hypothetical protein